VLQNVARRCRLIRGRTIRTRTIGCAEIHTRQWRISARPKSECAEIRTHPISDTPEYLTLSVRIKIYAAGNWNKAVFSNRSEKFCSGVKSLSTSLKVQPISVKDF
jgi:hypothetical protein